MHRTYAACLVAAALLAWPAAAVADRLPGHAIEAGGAATDDFRVDGALLTETEMPGVIERDRMYMAARPGFQSKHLPLTFDAAGQLYAGGFYLFDTHSDARRFADWVTNDFALDGVLILQRDYFSDVKAYPWAVIGAHEFEPRRTDQVVIRSERWQTRGQAGVRSRLRLLWPSIRREALERGHTAVWLLHNEQQQLVSIVYFDDRAGPWDRSAPDFASRDALAAAPPLGARFGALGWTNTFDRTSWLLTLWLPFAAGDSGEAAIWPGSPPFPQPSISDGVCEPSRGENSTTAPADCTPDCGNAIWDADEDNRRCPSDVPYTAAAARRG